MRADLCATQRRTLRRGAHDFQEPSRAEIFSEDHYAAADGAVRSPALNYALLARLAFMIIIRAVER